MEVKKVGDRAIEITDTKSETKTYIYDALVRQRADLVAELAKIDALLEHCEKAGIS